MRDAAVATRRVVARSRAPKAPPKRHPLTIVGAPLVRLVRAYPGRSAAAALVGTLMAGIVGNAILFQHGRHPAPLFGSPPGDTRPDRSTPPAVPLPRPRPAEAAAGSAPDAAPTPADAPAADPTPIRPTPAPVRTTPAGKRKPDGISALLRDDPPPAGSLPKTPDPAVLQAQRALVRLGYDLKPDGLMGAATRQALDKFAGERHLPMMSATPDPRLLHALLQAAGKPQE